MSDDDILASLETTVRLQALSDLGGDVDTWCMNIRLLINVTFHMSVSPSVCYAINNPYTAIRCCSCLSVLSHFPVHSLTLYSAKLITVLHWIMWSWYSLPRPFLAVPNVTAHPSTATITILLYNGQLVRSFNVPIKGLNTCSQCTYTPITHTIPVLYIYLIFWYILYFTFRDVSLVGLAFDLVNWLLSFNAMTLLFGSSELKNRPYNVLSGTLNPTTYLPAPSYQIHLFT